MRKLLLILVITCLSVTLMAGAAFASHFDVGGAGDRVKTITATNCVECHENSPKHGTGPHGGYASSTDKCSTCHDVHADATNAQLLMGETLTDACNYCHDLTATNNGPYNMTGGLVTAAAHRVVGVPVGSYTDTEGHNNSELSEGITTIPGGNVTDGTAGVLDTTGQGTLSGNVFTCNSCHTPHGVNTVANYLGESQVKVTTRDMAEGTYKIRLTNRLLKVKPNNAGTAVTKYGSAWCAACHKGRNNDISAKHNHPVDETAPAYKFLELAWQKGWFTVNTGNMAVDIANVTADGLVSVGPGMEITSDPRTNQQYAMNSIDELTNLDRATKDGYDAIANYNNVGPSCQQCHASARNVEDKFAANSNPQRGNFPHISNNKGLLIEVVDDFCTNCHAPSVLP